MLSFDFQQLQLCTKSMGEWVLVWLGGDQSMELFPISCASGQFATALISVIHENWYVLYMETIISFIDYLRVLVDSGIVDLQSLRNTLSSILRVTRFMCVKLMP